MKREQQLDLFGARKRRDAGIQSAAEHAGHAWNVLAYQFLEGFATAADRPFLIENVVTAAAEAGIPEPPDRRAWGGVVQRAHRAGKITKCGFAASASSNCSPMLLWRRA